MKFVVRDVPLKLMSSSVILNQEDAKELGLVVGDRVSVTSEEKTCIKDVHIAVEMMERGEIGFCRTEGPCEMRPTEGTVAEVTPVPRPKSIGYILDKLKGGSYNNGQMNTVIKDIVENQLNEVELTAFVMGNYLRKVEFDEIEAMTRAMINTGAKISIGQTPVVDKHSIGGVPGNTISLLVVPIIAAAGLLIPKTSSRAITSASGTADTMEVLAPVDLTVEEIRDITTRVGGVIAWGGNSGIAPADDIIIRIERHLLIDPFPQLLASVISKKGAAGADYAVIDIPVGGTKVKGVNHGRSLARDFNELGRRLGIEISCVLTDGSQPVSNAIGPALEAREAMHALEGKALSSTLIEKAVGVAGTLLEVSGKSDQGVKAAENLLSSGKALEKFREIINAQGGDGRISAETIPVGDFTATIEAPGEGFASSINSIGIVGIARAAGAPKDQGAGILLHQRKGSNITAGQPLFTIYAEKEWKLTQAIDLAQKNNPFQLSGMILEKYPKSTVL
ncbi:MAG: AMP phosphorylase [Methanomicrobiaceae archaeon]|nr:AMP phosphorylase [Methanomicrobiaceae archaeon]